MKKPAPPSKDDVPLSAPPRRVRIILFRSASRNFPADLEPELRGAGYEVTTMASLQAFIASPARREPQIVLVEIGAREELDRAVLLIDWNDHVQPFASARYVLLLASKSFQTGERSFKLASFETILLPQPTRNVLFKLELQARLLPNGGATPPRAGTEGFHARLEESTEGSRRRVLAVRGPGPRSGSWQAAEPTPSGKIRWRWVRAPGGQVAESHYAWTAESASAPQFEAQRNAWVLAEEDDVVCEAGRERLYSAREGFVGERIEAREGSSRADPQLAAKETVPLDREPLLVPEAERRTSGGDSLCGQGADLRLLARDHESPPDRSVSGEPLGEGAAFSILKADGALPPAPEKTKRPKDLAPGKESETPSEGSGMPFRAEPIPGEVPRAGGADQAAQRIEAEKRGAPLDPLFAPQGGRSESGKPWEPVAAPMGAAGSEYFSGDPGEAAPHVDGEAESALDIRPVSITFEKEESHSFSKHNVAGGLVNDLTQGIGPEKSLAKQTPAPPETLAAPEIVSESLSPSEPALEEKIPSKERELLLPPPDPLEPKLGTHAEVRARVVPDPPPAGEIVPKSAREVSDPRPTQDLPAPRAEVRAEKSGAEFPEERTRAQPGPRDEKIREPLTPPADRGSAPARGPAEKPTRAARAAAVERSGRPMPLRGEEEDPLRYLKQRHFEVLTLEQLGDQNSSWHPIGKHRIYLSAQHRYYGLKGPDHVLPLWVYDGELAPEFLDDQKAWKFYDHLPVPILSLASLPGEVLAALYQICGLPLPAELTPKRWGKAVVVFPPNLKKASPSTPGSEGNRGNEEMPRPGFWGRVRAFFKAKDGRG